MKYMQYASNNSGVLRLLIGRRMGPPSTSKRLTFQKQGKWYSQASKSLSAELQCKKIFPQDIQVRKTKAFS